MSKGFKCYFCGSELAWDSDADANEVSDMYCDDDTAVVSYYTCIRCGRSYEIIEPPKEEKETTYKDYWE